ncbi:hypothetical protein [Devosia sp. 2618]
MRTLFRPFAFGLSSAVTALFLVWFWVGAFNVTTSAVSQVASLVFTSRAV